MAYLYYVLINHNEIISVKHLLEFDTLGFAISNGELFSLRPLSSVVSSGCIDVYNIEPFTFQRTITVEGMKNPWDIVTSENVLYVSERRDKLIHRNSVARRNGVELDCTWLLVEFIDILEWKCHCSDVEF